MDFAVGYFVTDETVEPATLGRMVEERGFEALLLAEHTHIPASRETAYPAGGELPREYYRTLDPFVCLTAIAAATSTLKIGTGICLVVERDPIVTAKEVASVDLLSAGRMLFGVGAGWNLEEMRNHGTDPERRFGLLRERVEAMQAIWAAEIASYQGRQVSFEDICSWPKPVQDPHPPILVGGNGKRAPERAATWGDEWMPNRAGDDDRVMKRVAKLRDRGVPTTLANAPADAALLERYEAAGAHRAMFWVRPGDAEATERRLDRLAALTAEYAGA
jgi:probable F420-dependent oxidoreductase